LPPLKNQNQTKKTDMKKHNLNSMDRFRSAAEMSGKVALSFGLFAGAAGTQASTDYAPAHWVPAPSGYYYTTGFGHRFVVIHDIEGYYLSCISMLSQPNSRQVSINFVANGKKDTSTDHAAGEITQMVREAYYAWHVRCWNQYMVGTEHEGFASNPAWYTEAMYVASGALQDHLSTHYGVAQDRNHIIGHDQWRNSNWQTYMANLGYSSAFRTCNTP